MILFTNPVPAYSKSVRIHRAKVTFHLQPERPWAVFFHYETHKDTGQKIQFCLTICTLELANSSCITWMQYTHVRYVFPYFLEWKLLL